MKLLNSIDLIKNKDFYHKSKKKQKLNKINFFMHNIFCYLALSYEKGPRFLKSIKY